MGHRLSRITTRTGDAGETGLGDGSRVAKDTLRIQALGDVDELNSAIGMVLAEDLPAEVREALLAVQQDLFDLGGELCIPGHRILREAQVERLEALTAAAAHLARTVCRRAERSVVALGRSETVGDPVRQYLNRLSDLLFVLGRVLNRSAGRDDVLWQHERGS